MPGSSKPSRNSREAPPPVEQKESLSATLNFLAAVTESPPPTMEVQPLSARHSAMALALTRLPVRISSAWMALAMPWVPALVVWMIFRMFSKNLAKRRAENAKFLQLVWWPLKRQFGQAKQQAQYPEIDVMQIFPIWRNQEHSQDRAGCCNAQHRFLGEKFFNLFNHYLLTL